MGLFDFLKKKKALATPTTNDSTNSVLFPADDNTNPILAGHENYDQYTQLPHILGPDWNADASYHNPDRLHAPFTLERGRQELVSGAGLHYFDSADPTTQRIPRSALQVHFDQKKEIPIPPALVPENGVEVPRQILNYGWRQVFVAPPEPYSVSVLDVPSVKLSRPINVIQAMVNETHRPVLKAKAPKQKRSVQ